MTTASAAVEATAPLDPNMLAVLNVAQAFVRDLDGTIRFWSAGAERLYGWPRSEALGKRSYDLLATRFPRPFDVLQAELLQTGEWHGELQRRTRDGRALTVATQWALQRDAAGQPRNVVEINSDITFQQHGLTAVRRLAAIVESSNDAIIGKDLDSIVTDWNPAANAMFGYRADEIVGRPIVVLFPPDRINEEAVIVARIRRGETIDHYETVRRRKDGSDFPVSLSVSPIRDAAGAVVGASKILRDLTERRDREQRLREAQSELFHVQRLTELGQLVSSLVHEVNQPLAAIGNYANAGRRLLSAGNTDATRTALQKVVEQADRAHQIIQRLRNFARKDETEQRPEDLPGMIYEAVELASVTLKAEPTAFNTRLHPTASRVTANRVQIQQVLFNLMRNAMEAMERSPRREVVITAEPDEAGMVQLGVADTGPGLAPEVRDNLFRPFVTTKTGGMGIGLSICHSIVEAHGGRLWVEDNPGGGTVFRFTLAPSSDDGPVNTT